MKPIKSIGKLAMALAIVAMSSSLAMAGLNSGVLTVSAYITDQCQIGNSSLNFGPFVTGTTLPGTATLSVTCTNGTLARIYSQTLPINRTMALQNVAGKTAGPNGSTLTYRLFATNTDQANELIDLSSDGISNGLLTYTGTGQPGAPILYANIDSTQNGSAGIYYGTADLTITYGF
jgi:spore coat protein U-like protein